MIFFMNAWDLWAVGQFQSNISSLPTLLKLQFLCGFVDKLHIMGSFQVLYYSSSLMPPQPCHQAFIFVNIHCYQNFEHGCTAEKLFFFPFLGLHRKACWQTATTSPLNSTSMFFLEATVMWKLRIFWSWRYWLVTASRSCSHSPTKM